MVNGLGAMINVAAMLFAVLFLEKTLYLEPCPLCIIDRLIVAGMALIFLLAVLHNPARVGQRIYGFLAFSLAVTGMSVAGRHIWLQNLPADQVPECGATLDYMLETAPLLETLDFIFNGSGECAEVQWTFLGLTIPEQTLLLFTALAALSLVQVLRKSD